MTMQRAGSWKLGGVDATLAFALACSVVTSAAAGQYPPRSAGDGIGEVQRAFLDPPDDARVMMRWWWFGPAVTKPELRREILAMKAGGIGGFEIQPVYPLALDDKQMGVRNLPYLSDEFLDAVKYAAETGRDAGMRVDMTLASGWPYGGKHVPVDEAAARLRVVAMDVSPHAASVAVPAMENGERLIAMFLGTGTAKAYAAEKLQELTVGLSGGRVAFPTTSAPRVLVFYIAGRTGQQVKRAAVDAEGFVLDHFSRTAVADHLHTVGDRLMQAFGSTPPYSVFSDSLEVYGADWTDDLLPEFQRRRGYDLKPYLPELATGSGEVSAEVRHDWGLTLTELINERYLTQINEWAMAHHTRFRSQTYGDPAVSLSSNSLVALPEGEGPQWDRFSYTRWATSASHLYGRPVTSAETWTWLHSPAFRATPLDMKAEADCFFLQGVNQFIGHGWPYTPPSVAEPGWAFYAAAVFDDHNPWWIVMPDVMKYLQRVSYLLRQGKPADDVAVLLPVDDAYAAFVPGKVNLADSMQKYITPALMRQILSAGYSVDFIDAEAIKNAGIPYRALILPHVDRLSPGTLRAIATYAEHGGDVIALGAEPSLAPGMVDANARTAEVRGFSHALFTGNKHAQVIGVEEQLGASLRSLLPPSIDLSGEAAAIGFVERRLPDADIYFLANTSNQTIKTTAAFSTTHQHASSWDPFSGSVHPAEGTSVNLDLAPYESRIIVFSDAAMGAATSGKGGDVQLLADWTHDWRFTIYGTDPTTSVDRTMHDLSSWTNDPALHFYSGIGVYTKSVNVTSQDLANAKSLWLDFGKGTAIAPDPSIQNGTHALLEGPIREAALVTINGKRVGSVWVPPYRLDVTGFLTPGENKIEISVANTAISLLSGRALPDNHLLNARYGTRFVPQNMDHLVPLPSGILGPVQLLETK